MKRTFMALCDEINIPEKEFIHYFSQIAYHDQVNTAVLIGDKKILQFIPEIKQHYKKEYSTEINLNVLILQDLNNTDYLFDRFKFKIKEFPDHDILINIIHGSNKLSAIAMIISKLYGLKIQDRLQIDDTSNYSNFDVIEKNESSQKPMYYVKKLFNNYDFKLAKEVLEDNFSPINKTEKMFSRIIDIYGKWDSFEYDNYDFNSILNFFSSIQENIENNKKIKILLYRSNKNYNAYRISDLINNAKRRIEEERYDDAIIRLYRALELIGESELYEQYGIRKTDVHLEDIDKLNMDENAKRNVKKRLDFKYPRYQIPLTTTFFILQKLNDKVGLYYLKHKQKYQELFQKRNVSVLVHGNYKYTPREIKEMLDEVIELAVVYNNNVPKYMKQLEFPKFKI